MRPDDIIGYTYRADVYCPDCVIANLRTGPEEEFDGWALAEGVRMSVEENLAEIATAFGIDRMDERTYDSGEFPKVIFRGEDEQCGICGVPLA